MAWLAAALTAALLAAPVAGAAATVLVWHPYDAVDPFGLPPPSDAPFMPGGPTLDPFAVRYLRVAAAAGRFDYPTAIVDGTTAILALPDPARPLDGTLEAYESAVLARSLLPAPVGLVLASAWNETELPRTALDVTVRITADGAVETLGQPVDLHVAVVEDPVHYEPPVQVSNGVTEHRFVVRAWSRLPGVSIADGASFGVGIPREPEWNSTRLHVAAWLQAGASNSGRFARDEVLQAVSAPAGGEGEATTTARNVLLEVYSATWCDPCLHGDAAAEAIAIEYGGYEPLPAPEGLWAAPSVWTVVLMVGGAFAMAWRRV